MERRMTISFREIAESNFVFKSQNTAFKSGELYISEKVEFNEIKGNWSMNARMKQLSYNPNPSPDRHIRNIDLDFMIESNLPNLDYNRYTVNADVICQDRFGDIISSTTSNYFLRELLAFTSKVYILSDSISFRVKMSLSCCSHSHNYVDTNNVWKQIVTNNISMLSDSTYSDFTFVVGKEGKEFKVHKAILAATSPVFVKLFKQEMTENKCIINDITSDTFNHMIRFIYGGLLPDSIPDLAFSLYVAAHNYDIKNLMDICKESICLNLSASNASFVFLWAELCNVEDLKNDALQLLNIDQDKISPEMITTMIQQKESELQMLKSLSKFKELQKSNL